MAALEQTLFDSGMPVAALMEKVGLAMAAWLLARRDLLHHGVVVLVGPGHNGGDGLVVARELHLAGIAVSLWCPLPIRKPSRRNICGMGSGWVFAAWRKSPIQVARSCGWMRSSGSVRADRCLSC